MYARVCEPFVVAGIACATMDYRLAPADRWPAMPDDVAMAVRWLKARTEARNGEPTRLFLFGHSSGCHLAAALGANPKYLERVKLAPSELSGVILMGCMLGPLVNVPAGADLDALAARWAARSADAATYASLVDRLDSDPSRWVGPHMPPTLVVVAQAERFFPPILEQGATFVRRLLEHRRPAELVVVAGTHRSSITHVPEPGDETMAAAVAFIRHPEQAGASSREP
jgi:acetyl esterase/lipase